MRPTYQGTSHHATAAACALFAPAPLGVTQHTNERARATSTTAPSCPLHAHSTRGTGRAIADEATSVPRVVVVVASSVVCLSNTGITQDSATQRKSVTRNRNATTCSPRRSAPGLLRTCFVAIFHCDAAAGRPGEREHFMCLSNSCITFGSALNHWCKHRQPKYALRRVRSRRVFY